jgi:glycine cleavage system H lipoate-binding protein
VSEAPDFAEAVLGFRYWAIGSGGALLSVSARSPWEPGVNRAQCPNLRRDHEAPGTVCRCGFNAFHRPPRKDLPKNRYYAVGAIAAWGEIEVHARGFRAEYACVTALALLGTEPKERRAELEQASERYGAALVPYRRLRKEGSRFATSLPKAAIPLAREAQRRAIPALTPARLRPKGKPRPIGPEKGYWVGRHVIFDNGRGEAKVRITEAFAAVLPDRPLVYCLPADNRVAAGEALAAIDGGGESQVVVSPLDGIVVATNPRLVAQPELLARDPIGRGWVAKIAPDPVPVDFTPLVWGEEARRAYLAYLIRIGDDDAIRSDVSFRRHADRGRFGPPHRPRDPAGLVNPAAVRCAVEALEAALRGDPDLQQALTRLDGGVRFLVCDPEVELSLIAKDEDGSHLHFGPAPGTEMAVRLSGDSLHRLLLAELDVPRALGEGAIEVVDGTRAQLVLVTSLLQRLRGAYRRHAAAVRAAHQQGIIRTAGAVHPLGR